MNREVFASQGPIHVTTSLQQTWLEFPRLGLITLILKRCVPTKKFWAATAKSQQFQVRFSTPLHRKHGAVTDCEQIVRDHFWAWMTIFGPECMNPKIPWDRNKQRIVYWAIGILILQLNIIPCLKPWAGTMHTQFAGATGYKGDLGGSTASIQLHIHARVHTPWMVNGYDFFGSVACLAFWGRGSFKSGGLPVDGDALEAGAGWRLASWIRCQCDPCVSPSCRRPWS